MALAAGASLMRRVVLEAVDPGHGEVHDDEVRPLAHRQAHPGLAIGRGHHGVAVALEQPRQQFAVELVILDHQDFRHLSAPGAAPAIPVD